MEENLSLQREVSERVEAILSRVFTGERAVVRRMHDRLNFACPFCGDSETNSRKKRANIYWETMRFCCFNSGCARPRSNVMQFLAHFGERMSTIEGVSEVSERIALGRVHRASDIDVGVFKDLVEQAVPLGEVEQSRSLVRIDDSGFASDYVRSRSLWGFRDGLRYCPRENSIYVLNQANGGAVLGYQVRRFSGEPKYVSFNLERVMLDTGRVMRGDQAERTRANTLSLFFGLLQCDFSRPATVFEGRFDSLFVPNSVAITGLQKDLGYFDPGGRVRFMLDNDRSGRGVAEALLRSGKPVFMWEKYLSDNKISKDVKDLNELVVLTGIDRWDPSRIDGYFSDDPLDLINV